MSRLTNTTTASQHSYDTAGATSGATARATTSHTSSTISDDEDQDDDFTTSNEDHQPEGPGFESGNYKEKTGKTIQTEQQNTDKDFMFDKEKNDSEAIVISFWSK